MRFLRSGVPLLLLIACGGHHPADRSRHPPPIDPAGRELTASEKKGVDGNGFAIIADGQTPSFHVGYTALFHAHQPVYITADSLLYAWHSSYDAILMELEQDHLIALVTSMLAELRDGLASSTADPQTRKDVDVYLAVASSLITNKPARGVAGGDAAEMAGLALNGNKAEGRGLTLFGHDDHFDWSMFKPRGHYTSTEQLSQYFRAMQWLGRAEVRIAQKSGSAWVVNRRAFNAAKLLASLFTPKITSKWSALDTTIAAFVGPPDSMSLPGLTRGFTTLGASDRDADIVAAFENESAQKIRTQMLQPGAGDIAFVTFGARFVFDAKVFTDVTYGNLQSYRMMPSPLDVAYAVFHNPAAKNLLAKELAGNAEYAKALEASKLESTKEPALWDGNLYHLWMTALRGLSEPGANLPEPFHSDAWGRRLLNTQLASWAELRHDNLLYAKQSFTAEALCAYPAAYVDPYPAFFAAMEALAIKGKSTIEQLPFHSAKDKKLVAYFETLRTTMAKLHAMADRETANKELSDDDLAWVNHMVSMDARSGGCTTVRIPEGWYADLYYDRDKILYHQPIVADVHTQPTDEAGNPVGLVLHVGTGFPHMLVATLEHDAGKNRQTYRGYVSTYAELVTKDFQRLDDETWRSQLETAPSVPPPWLESLLAH